MKIELVTYDYDNNYKLSKVMIRLKDIDDLTNNFLKMKFTYKTWVDDGKFEFKEFYLTPESLLDLLNALENSKYKKKMTLNTSYGFLKSFDTSKKLFEYLEKIKTLPVL